MNGRGQRPAPATKGHPTMRTLAMTLALVAPLAATGCMTLHAQLPEDAVRHHMAREEGLDLPALCTLDGRNFSEGALVCTAGHRMTCEAPGRWVEAEGPGC